MKLIIKNKIAESIVGIIIGVFILSFVLLGIGTLIGNSKDSISTFNDKMNKDILLKNTSNIINNLDLSILEDGDIFYIYKDKTNKNFKIFIGEHNREYKYINKYGEKVNNIINYNGIIFERILQARKININGKQKTAVKILIKKLIR